ncbi:MAG TPA: hypothetical protein VF754_06875, partial [Pyrinomonadaceae bacterium]
MSRHGRPRAQTLLASLTLTAALTSSLFVSGKAGAQTSLGRLPPAGTTLAQDEIVPPAPPEQLDMPSRGAHDKISRDLKALLKSKSKNDTVKIILQQNRPATLQLLTLLGRTRTLSKKQFSNLSAMALEVPAGSIEELAAV